MVLADSHINFFTSKPLENYLQHVINSFCNFRDDLILRSGINGSLIKLYNGSLLEKKEISYY